MPRMGQDTTATVDVGGSYVSTYNYGRTHVGGPVVFRPNWGFYSSFCNWGAGIAIRTRRKIYPNGPGGSLLGQPGPVIGQWQSWTHAERGAVKHVHALDGNINHPTGEFVVEVKHLVACNCGGEFPHSHPAAYRGSNMDLTLRVDWNQPG